MEQGRDRVVGHVNKVGYVKRVIGKRRKSYRRVRRSSPTSSKALQELFVSCRDTFKGPGTVPSSQDVHKLCHIIGIYTTFCLFYFYSVMFGPRHNYDLLCMLYMPLDLSLFLLYLDLSLHVFNVSIHQLLNSLSIRYGGARRFWT